MAETKKFTKKELEKVKEIQDNYFSVQSELGALSLTELHVKESKKSLEERLKEVKKDEKIFLDSITEKYGRGSLNPESGEFTPTE